MPSCPFLLLFPLANFAVNKNETNSLVLVAGFLGAGKTTLMRRLIRNGHAHGLKLSLVVNEFGVADIDSQLLHDSGAELASSLAGGCACCSGQEEMVWTLL